jgi:dienelactone hydrolase
VHWLDRALYLALPRQPFFAGGWGDRRVLEERRIERLRGLPPDPVEVRWEREERRSGARVRIGWFDSPEQLLPAEGRRARVQLLLPETGEPRAVCVHLAASGDQGFGPRARFAGPLLRRGLAALILENAYYGERRPTGQPGAAVRTVSDLVVMGSATVREARALLAWLRGQGHPRVGVAGYSMGGQMAAVVAASLPFPLAVAAMAPSNSPATVFTEGLLSTHPRWDALTRPGERPEKARAALRERFLPFAVTALPPPAEPRAAVVVGNRGDGVVAPADMQRIAEHWGCEMRWLDTGHVGAVLWHQEALRAAVADAFDRLPDGD